LVLAFDRGFGAWKFSTCSVRCHGRHPQRQSCKLRIAVTCRRSIGP
jgi:hypothetical protein